MSTIPTPTVSQAAPAMSYAQALTEARHTIVQQQLRIRADADKIRGHVQAIAEQAAQLADADRRGGEQAAELERLVGQTEVLGNRLQEMTTAKEQADAVIDRQGQRMTSVQEQVARLERQTAEQAAQIADLSAQLSDTARRLEETTGLLPTREDEEALASMSDLLGKRSAAMARRAAGPVMRMADDSPAAEAPTAGEPMEATARTEAA
jgi:chromosome segregation ATPase